MHSIEDTSNFAEKQHLLYWCVLWCAILLYIRNGTEKI